MFGLLLYIGEPGLQYILTYFTVAISSLSTIIAILIVRNNRNQVRISLSILLITLATGTPMWFQNFLNQGNMMQIIGLLCFGLGIPIQITLYIKSIKKGSH